MIHFLHTKNARAFTLIETVVYLGLFSIIMGGVLVSAYNLIESGQRTQAVIGTQEEGIFLNRKLQWAISGATSASTLGPDTLVLTRPDLPANENPLTFTTTGTGLTLKRGSQTAQSLNGDGFPVTNFSAAVTHTSGKPDSVSVTFELAGQPFIFDTYLRK